MVIEINGVALPKVMPPLDVGYHIIDNAERNARGTMIHEFIARKFKVTANFGLLTKAEAKTILTAVLSGNGLDLSVKFYNPHTDSITTFSGYVQQDINLGMLHYNASTGQPRHYDGLSLAFIQN